MNKTILSTIIICLCLVVGCKKRNNEVPQSIMDEIAHISSIPDSLLSPSQTSKVISILTIMKENLQIDGDKFITTATVNDFKKEGLSKDYYNLLLNDIEGINSNRDFFTEPIDEVYEDMMKDLDERLLALTVKKESSKEVE